MSIRERIATALFGTVIEAQVKERLAAASVTDEEDEGWKRLTGDSQRKLPSISQDRAIEISYWLWKNNPLANWIVEIVTAFVVGGGLDIDAKNEKVQEVLDKFWDDPLNCMDIYLEKYTRELGIYGEQCWTKFTAEQTGRVRLGYIDPANIKAVVTDPENVKLVIGVILKDKAGRDGKRYKTVLPAEAESIISPSARGKRARYKDGECYFFSINNVTNEPRGTSDLLVLADWLDAYEQFLFDYADKWPLLNTFVWDLLIDGATEDVIKEELKKFTKKAGSVYAHNEKITLTAETPKLRAVEAKEGAALLRNHILGNRSIPEHWYGGGGDVNRATAMEMGAPAFKMMSSRQKIIIYIINYVLTDVLLEAEKRNMLQGVKDDEKTFTINTPELATKDITKFATTIQQLTTSLSQARVNGWIDEETAVKAFAFALSLVGYELDVEAIKKKLKNEEGTKGYEDYADS